MDRKTFIKASGMVTGFAIVPSILKSEVNSIEPGREVNLDPKIVRGDEGEVLNVIGDIQTHKLTGSETNNQIVEWVDNVEPGVGIPPHIHTKEDEIFRVIKGQVEIMVDGKTTVLKAGDLAFAQKMYPIHGK